MYSKENRVRKQAKIYRDQQMRYMLKKKTQPGRASLQLEPLTYFGTEVGRTEGVEDKS